jgi:hypothetical protein
MSSHHIVREHQEPALIIWSGLELLSSETLDGLLEWSPLIMVYAPMLKTVIRKGLKLDIVLGTESELFDWKEELENQQPLEKFYLKGNHHEIDCLMKYVSVRGIKQANLILDDPHSAQSFLFSEVEFVFYTQNKRGITIAPGGNFQKWLMPGQHFFTKPEESLKIDSPISGNNTVIHTTSYSTNITGVHTFYNLSEKPLILWQVVT